MIQIRPSSERGAVNIGWLESKHSFSFGHYYDANHMGFRNLRVINEDKVLPNQGFGTHGHRDMEIISYIISGELAHKDSMGNGSTIRKGDVQRMSAGTGVRHSEFNASDSETVHFLQIWILPNQNGHSPGYEERNFQEKKHNNLCLLVSGYDKTNALNINADVHLFGSELEQNKDLTYAIKDKRHVWIQIIHGELKIKSTDDSILVQAGDGVAISNLSSIQLKAQKKCEFLLFDLP